MYIPKLSLLNGWNKILKENKSNYGILSHLHKEMIKQTHDLSVTHNDSICRLTDVIYMLMFQLNILSG